MKTYYVEGNVCYLDFSVPPLLEMPSFDLEVIYLLVTQK